MRGKPEIEDLISGASATLTLTARITYKQPYIYSTADTESVQKELNQN